MSTLWSCEARCVAENKKVGPGSVDVPKTMSPFPPKPSYHQAGRVPIGCANCPKLLFCARDTTLVTSCRRKGELRRRRRSERKRESERRYECECKGKCKCKYGGESEDVTDRWLIIDAYPAFRMSKNLMSKAAPTSKHKLWTVI